MEEACTRRLYMFVEFGKVVARERVYLYYKYIYYACTFIHVNDVIKMEVHTRRLTLKHAQGTNVIRDRD